MLAGMVRTPPAMPPATSPRSDAFNELSYASRLSTRSPSVRINAWRSFTNPVTQQTLDAGVDDGADLVGHHGRRAHRRETLREIGAQGGSASSSAAFGLGPRASWAAGW